MDKYKAWIGALTPLNFTNEKSLEQIMYELIPIILEIKEKQDTYPNLFKEFMLELNTKIEKIKNSLPTYNTTFAEKRNSIRQNVSNKETEITTNILNKFSEILNKITTFGSTYFETHPEVFDNGIIDVNFDLNINRSCYSIWSKSGGFIYNDDDINYGKTERGYSYDPNTHTLYYGGHVAGLGGYFGFNDLNRCTNGVIINNLPKMNLGEAILPLNENGYFIGFPDELHAAYFEETNEENIQKYSLKLVNIDTKEITTYENLEFPNNFKNVYLIDNSHYNIKKCNDYYYLLYLVENSNSPKICKSNDLIHWENVGSVATGDNICCLTNLNNHLYWVTNTRSSYLFNENDNSFNQIKINNKNIMIGFYKDNKYYGYSNGYIYSSNTPDFTNYTEERSSTFYPENNNMAFSFSSDTNLGVICGCSIFYEPNRFEISSEYPSFNYRIDKYKYTTYCIDYDIHYDQVSRRNIKSRRFFKGLPHDEIKGNIVISPTNRVFDDKNLREITFTYECVEVGR